MQTGTGQRACARSRALTVWLPHRCWGMVFPAPGAASVARMNRLAKIADELEEMEAQGPGAAAHALSWKQVEAVEAAREENLATEAEAAAEGP
jgi:hypothetical protein